MIQVINVILKYICIGIIRKTKFHTATQEDTAIMATVYISQLFNTGFLLLMMNANFSEFGSESLKQIFFGGRLTDFGTLWYKKVGIVIVSTMQFGIVMPVLEFGGMWLMKAVLRLKDRGWTSDGTKTNCKGMQ